LVQRVKAILALFRHAGDKTILGRS